MKISNHILKLETLLLFTMGMVIFLSKPAIYLVSLLLLSLTCVRLVSDFRYRTSVLSDRMFWASTGLFFLGVVGAAIGSSHINDVGWMVKKTMFLPMIVPFLIAFTYQHNRTAALAGVLSGFWIAFILTANMYDWQLSGGRYEGATWDVGMWGVLCSMLMVLLTPIFFTHRLELKWRALIGFTFLGAALMLITTGSRGPMLGAAAGVLIYLVLKQRKALIGLVIVGAVGLYTAATVWPQQINSFQERALSVTDTKTDASNYIRLALWETGLEQIKYQLFQGDLGFWLGSGHDGHESISSSFYERFAPSATIKPGLLLELGAPKNEIVRDFHNMYIQSAVVAGTPWTLGVLIMLVSLLIRAKKSNADGPARWGSLPTLTCYLVTGITYAILPHFAFLIVIYILSLTFYSE